MNEETPVQAKIATLDDRAALDIVTRYAAARLRAGELETECTPDIRQALTDEFGTSTAGEVSEGDLARAALAVLAEDPRNHDMLQAFLDGPPAERMGVAATIAIVTAALVVLQTSVKIEHKDGRTTVVIHKPSMKDSALVKLAAKLLRFAG